MARRYILTALGYALLGLILGIYMASSQNHSQLIAHAHILLIGFVVSFIYGILYKLWPINLASVMVKIQFIAHQIGIILLAGGLFLLYGGYAAPTILEPILAIGSLAVLLGMIMMKVLFLKASKEPDLNPNSAAQPV